MQNTKNNLANLMKTDKDVNYCICIEKNLVNALVNKLYPYCILICGIPSSI